MTGLSRTSADLDPRRKRLLFRAWHRGTREMDLLMGPYTQSVIAALGDDDLAALEALIELDDHDLYAWLTGAATIAPEHDTPVFRGMRAFYAHGGKHDL